MATLPDDRPIDLPAAPLWVDGRIVLRVEEPGGGPGPVVAMDRPYALVGRIAGADVRLADPAVSARHVYLHLDRRGLYAVDLATRTGTHVGPAGRPAGWLGVGEAIEVAGRRVVLVEATVAGASPAGLMPGDSDDPLADSGPSPLRRVTLFPARSPESPLVLGSELVFLGRSPSCGVRVDGEAASRTHCVVVRTRTAAFLVDLVGRATWLNGRPLRGAAALADGDSLMVGSTQFDVRVEPAGPPRGVGLPAPAPGRDHLPAEILAATTAPAPAGAFGAGLPPLPPDLISTEAQGQLLAWMMGVLQAGQAEILRQQAEFQRSMALMVRQIHLDNSALLAKHMERVDHINRELSALRDEIRRRFGAADAARPAPAVPTLPALPPATPLRVTPHVPPADPAAATSWLLDRVSQLEQENRSSWRDLLGRLARLPRRPS